MMDTIPGTVDTKIMDSIETFTIELDVNPCEKIYDYGNSEFLHRPPSGFWDLW